MCRAGTESPARAYAGSVNSEAPRPERCQLARVFFPAPAAKGSAVPAVTQNRARPSWLLLLRDCPDADALFLASCLRVPFSSSQFFLLNLTCSCFHINWYSHKLTPFSPCPLKRGFKYQHKAAPGNLDKARTPPKIPCW